MKRGTPGHPKTISLAKRLRMPIYAAVGILEMLWHWTSQYARDGGIGRFPDSTIAEAVGWKGQPKNLIEALIETGWIDEAEGHERGARGVPEGCRLFVHDWPEHCDDAVSMGLARSGLFFANGEKPKLSRLSTEERRKIEELYAQKTHAVCTENALPKPEPKPSHAKPPPADAGTTDPPSAEDDDQAFAKEWLIEHYPDPSKLSFENSKGIPARFLSMLTRFGRDPACQAVLEAATKGDIGEPVSYAEKVLMERKNQKAMKHAKPDDRAMAHQYARCPDD